MDLVKLPRQAAKLRFLMLQTEVVTGEQANAHLEKLDLLRYEEVRLLANIRLFLRATPNELNLVIQLTQGNSLPKGQLSQQNGLTTKIRVSMI